MQIWVYYIGGAGGESLCVLLEKSKNIHPLDNQDLSQWRLNRYVDGSPKFWTPSIYAENTFRNDHQTPFNQSYLEAIHLDKNIVTCSHAIATEDFYSGIGSEYYTKNRKTICIVPDLNNIEKTFLSLQKKQLQPQRLDLENCNYYKSYIEYANKCVQELDKFDYLIHDLDDLDQVEKIHIDLGLEYSRDTIEEWKQVRHGNLSWTTPGVPMYESYVENNQLHYKELGSFQCT